MAAEEAEATRMAAAAPPGDGVPNPADAAAAGTALAAGEVEKKAADAAEPPKAKQEENKINKQPEQEETSPEAKVTTTMSEDENYKIFTIIIRFSKEGIITSNGDGNDAKQALETIIRGIKSGGKKHKRNLTKKRHRKNT